LLAVVAVVATTLALAVEQEDIGLALAASSLVAVQLQRLLHVLVQEVTQLPLEQVVPVASILTP
jgi:hypothetical protein